MQSLDLYIWRVFQWSFNEEFLCDATAIFMSLQVLLLWSLITIWGLLFSICMYLYIPKYRSFYIFIDRCWFMFIPLVRYLDVVVLTCFPMYKPLPCCVFGYTQLLQVQDSQTQCGLSFPRIYGISCTLDQCCLL